MKIEADFSKISSNTERLAAGSYRFAIVSAQEQDAADVKAGNLAAFIITSEVVAGERIGAQTQDWQYLKQKDGKPNKMGLGRIKAYAEATLGAERANAQDFDTDELIGNQFDGEMVSESYTDKSVTPPVQKTSVKLGKILPVS